MRNQAAAVLGHQRQPRMPAAIEMEQLAEAAPLLPRPPMTTARLKPRHEPGRLEGLFHEAVGQRDRVLAPDRLVEMSHIEAAVTLAIEPEHALDLRQRHPSLRRSPMPFVNQSVVPANLIPPAQSPQRARRNSNDLRRAEPMHLATQRPQNHVLDFHRPLPGRVRIAHRASCAQVVPENASQYEADRSLATPSGQIMYSLHGCGIPLTRLCCATILGTRKWRVLTPHARL